MDLTRTAYGTWSAGRFMHFGEMVDEKRFGDLIRLAYESGVRTFITADVYGSGRADEMLGQALEGIDRSTYCLVGAIGHDFYEGQRQGSSGYPRFTSPELRGPQGYADFVTMATEKSLERCRTDHFDLLMLHNPDNRGYADESVWKALTGARDAGLTRQLGIAPGPANGFTLDVVDSFERFGEVIDWAMLILNPVEPWPGRLPLAAAVKNDVKVLTRVVDHGGIFHGDVKPGHFFREGDHRTYRPEGWVEHAFEKMEKMLPIAEKHGLSVIQLACQWNLCQEPVRCVAPTFIQEAGENAVPVEDKIRDFAATPVENVLSAEEVEEIARIGDNTGCMKLKGASKRHEEQLRPDEWPMREELLAVGQKWGLGTEW
jgi:aryl-alcohol dehydrogenase-like predicted oxidoreductase